MTDRIGQWPESLSSRMHDLLRVATAPAPLAPVAPPAEPPARSEQTERALRLDGTPTTPTGDDSPA